MKKLFKNRYWRLTFIYFFLTVVLLVLILFFGMKTAVKISEVFQNRQSLPISSLNQNTLTEPKFESFPSATNSAEFKISGFSMANHSVEIFLDGDLVKTVPTDTEGRFEAKVLLSLGENSLYAVTIDNENQTSLPSATLNIFYKNTPPLLEITEPENNSLIKKNATISIKGKTESETKVYINGRLVVTDSEGYFSSAVKLNEGKNTFSITAIDMAMNNQVKDLVINFQP